SSRTNTTSPSRPPRIDQYRLPVHRIGILAGEIHRCAGELLHVEKIPARGRERAHQGDVALLAGPPQMRVERRGDVAGRERVDVDALAAELGRERLGQVHDAAL